MYKIRFIANNDSNKINLDAHQGILSSTLPKLGEYICLSDDNYQYYSVVHIVHHFSPQLKPTNPPAFNNVDIYIKMTTEPTFD